MLDGVSLKFLYRLNIGFLDDGEFERYVESLLLVQVLLVLFNNRFEGRRILFLHLSSLAPQGFVGVPKKKEPSHKILRRERVRIEGLATAPGFIGKFLVL